MPFRSLNEWKFAAFDVATPSTIWGRRPSSAKAWKYSFLLCMLIVCSYAPDTTSALPPTTALSAFEPPLKSLILRFEPLVLEIPELLGDGERQVVERGLAADRDVDVGLFQLALGLGA